MNRTFSLEFDDIGAKLFEQITGQNVKKRLAIILDDNVYSAPVIQERIAGGRAQITGPIRYEGSRRPRHRLRAVALPAPVKYIEERTWDPLSARTPFEKGVISIVVSAIWSPSHVSTIGYQEW